MKTQIGQVVSGDFEDNTLTLEIDGDMIIKVGTYAVVPIEDYNKILSALKSAYKCSGERNFLTKPVLDEMLEAINIELSN